MTARGLAAVQELALLESTFRNSAEEICRLGVQVCHGT